MLDVQAALLGAFVWIGGVLLARSLVAPLLRRGPGDSVTTLLWLGVRIYARLVHRVRIEGEPAVRETRFPGGLIVVSNHTGSADPLLIQSACRFHIRWMMADVMMTPGLDWLWRHERMIPVARDGSDSGPLRQAIRHVEQGGVIGVFPEGRIVTPPRRIWPFHKGVGLVVSRTNAPVLLVWISGTPDTTDFRRSIATPSHARLVFVDLIDFGDERDPERIARTLRERIAEVSGWPIEDDLPPPVEFSSDPFNPYRRIPTEPPPAAASRVTGASPATICA